MQLANRLLTVIHADRVHCKAVINILVATATCFSQSRRCLLGKHSNNDNNINNTATNMGTTNMEALERKLKEETDKYLRLKQLVDRDTRERVSREKAVVVHSREVDFIQEKIKSIGVDNLELKFGRLRQLALEVQEKRDRLDKLRKITREFDDFEPTNEALREKIESLDKSRLSLDLYLF